MSAPGGGFDQGGHGDEANPSQTGGRAPEQPDWHAPWDPPAAENPPHAYSPPNYPPGYPAEYPPPGYGQPPGYGGPLYPPGPPYYPGAHHPAPGYPGGYWHQEGTQPGTNRLAIASLVSALVGVLCFIGAIVAIVLGTVAVDQIKQTREEGYGLAVAGIVIGIATLIVYLVIGILAMRPQ